MTTTDTTLLDGTTVGDRVYLVSNGSRYDRLSSDTFEVIRVSPTTITIQFQSGAASTYRKYNTSGGYLAGRYMESGTDQDPWNRNYLVAATDPMVARRDRENRVAAAKGAATRAAEKFARTLSFEDKVASDEAVKAYWMIQDEA